MNVSWDSRNFQFSKNCRIGWVWKIDYPEWVNGLEGYEISSITDESGTPNCLTWSDAIDLTYLIEADLSIVLKNSNSVGWTIED